MIVPLTPFFVYTAVFITLYYMFCHVNKLDIFHWYGKQKEREGFKGNMMREGKRKLRGIQREEANSESSEIT